MYVCTLHAYTNYTVSVQVRPTNGGYWSDITMITATTAESGKSLFSLRRS